MFNQLTQNPLLLLAAAFIGYQILQPLLTKEHISGTPSKKGTFVFFHAPWCPHCRDALPKFLAAKEAYNGPIKMKSVDCVKNKRLAELHRVSGYPTYRMYHNGFSPNGSYTEYTKSREGRAIADFLNAYN